MSTHIDPLEVTISGGTAETNTLVSGVVQTALDEAGFTDITVNSPHGDAGVDEDAMPSLLDIIRVKNPDMFDTPIKINQHVSADAIANLPNVSATAAAIANAVYAGVLDAAVVEEVAAVFIEEEGVVNDAVQDDIPF